MPVPPQRANIHIDSCAFDPKYDPENRAAEKIFYLYENRTDFILEISHSVHKEIDHPNTPLWVKERANKIPFTLESSLTEQQKDFLRNIERILSGNGNIENIRQDARHIFEANGHGDYFVTTDQRILKKRIQLHEICSYSLSVVKPSELWVLIEKYDSRFNSGIPIPGEILNSGDTNSGDTHRNPN